MTRKDTVRALTLFALLSITARPAFARPAPANVAQRHAEAVQLIDRSLKVMLGERSQTTLTGLSEEIRIATFHLADGDHAGPPYIPDYGDATLIEDLAGSRRLITSLEQLATGPSRTTEELVTPTARTVRQIQTGAPPFEQVTPAPPAWRLNQPLQLLRAARAAPDVVLVGRAILHGAPATILGFGIDGFAARLIIADGTGLPMAAEAIVVQPDSIAWSSRGDLKLRVEWQNWTYVHGVRLPFQIDESLNGAPSRSISVRSAALNPAIEARRLSIEPAMTAMLDRPGSRDVDELPLGRADRPVTEIAPGVVQIPGSWYTTLVREPDGIIIIDAPISNGYSRKVMAEAARRFPGIPIKAVISTTSFNWHIAGLREYAAQGIPIYALDRNVPVVKALLSAPHKLRPDTLARRPQKTSIIPVSSPISLGTGPGRLTLYPIRRASGPMLMVHLPAVEMLHTAEMVQPLGPGGALILPESLQEITDEVAVRGIKVKTMIGMHMSPTPWSWVTDALVEARSATS
ncbi:hypothetical protein ACVWZA_001511 [Sphingomonas sp. UYAg733]